MGWAHEYILFVFNLGLNMHILQDTFFSFQCLSIDLLRLRPDMALYVART